MDFFFLVIFAALIAASIALISFCERLSKKP